MGDYCDSLHLIAAVEDCSRAVNLLCNKGFSLPMEIQNVLIVSDERISSSFSFISVNGEIGRISFHEVWEWKEAGSVLRNKEISRLYEEKKNN